MKYFSFIVFFAIVAFAVASRTKVPTIKFVDDCSKRKDFAETNVLKDSDACTYAACYDTVNGKEVAYTPIGASLKARAKCCCLESSESQDDSDDSSE